MLGRIHLNIVDKDQVDAVAEFTVLARFLLVAARRSSGLHRLNTQELEIFQNSWFIADNFDSDV